MESANFHVTGTRLKPWGMRWSYEGAREMAALRADLFNRRHEARTRQILAACSDPREPRPLSGPPVVEAVDIP